MDGFQEVTLLGRDNEEIMINIDLKTGKILRAYCYASDIPLIYSGPEGMKERPARAFEMTNQLFKRLHLGDLKTYSWQENIYASLEDEDSEHFNEELDAIVRESIDTHLPAVEIL
jgi:hypothetical protein